MFLLPKSFKFYILHNISTTTWKCIQNAQIMGTSCWLWCSCIRAWESWKKGFESAVKPRTAIKGTASYTLRCVWISTTQSAIRDSQDQARLVPPLAKSRASKTPSCKKLSIILCFQKSVTMSSNNLVAVLSRKRFLRDLIYAMPKIAHFDALPAWVPGSLKNTFSFFMKGVQVILSQMTFDGPLKIWKEKTFITFSAADTNGFQSILIYNISTTIRLNI